MEQGLKDDIPMDAYLRLNAFGSGHLDWLAISPMRYRYNLEHPPEESESMAIGTAVHSLVLEPHTFQKIYELEPLSAAPDAKSPRATNAYKDAVKSIEASGKRIIRMQDLAKVNAMAQSVMRNRHAAKCLEKAQRREVTMIWKDKDRLCRGRADALGDKLLVDLKVTRDLSGFSPWIITRLGYYRQQAWYRTGLDALGHGVDHVFIVAVEQDPPHDVGVFKMDDASLIFGAMQCKRLLEVCEECEKTGEWPGMFPDVEVGTVSDSVIDQFQEEADGEDT